MSNPGLLTFVSFLSSNFTAGSVDIEQMNYPVAANETYQSNPINNSAYASQVGSTPTTYATLSADVAMTLSYDTSPDAQTWTNTVHTYSYTPSTAQTFTAVYSGVEYGRFRLINGSTAATVTNLDIGLRH